MVDWAFTPFNIEMSKLPMVLYLCQIICVWLSLLIFQLPLNYQDPARKDHRQHVQLAIRGIYLDQPR
jgi:hypothetical protein